MTNSRTIIATVFACALLCYCTALVPPAMENETDHQRVIAAGQYRHVAGYSDYQQVVEANP